MTRNSGKTTAIIRSINTKKKSFLVVHSYSAKFYIMDLLFAIHGEDCMNVKVVVADELGMEKLLMSCPHIPLHVDHAVWDFCKPKLVDMLIEDMKRRDYVLSASSESSGSDTR